MSAADGNMVDTHKGACLCGAVRFEITGAFEHFFLCHCSRCRKSTGSAHAANLFSNAAQLTWLSGEDKVRVYDLPETRFTKAFCSECGGALPRVHAPGRLQVPAGCLDTPVPIRPEAHIFHAHRANWDENLHDIACFDQRPG